MTQDLTNAAERLSYVLDQENVALAALEFHIVGTLVVEKRLAIEALQSLGMTRAKSPSGLEEPGLRKAALRLQDLAKENKRLLERAMSVQTRIMGVIASAARTTQVPSGYGGQGRHRPSRSTSAMALLVRA